MMPPATRVRPGSVAAVAVAVAVLASTAQGCQVRTAFRIGVWVGERHSRADGSVVMPHGEGEPAPAR